MTEPVYTRRRVLRAGGSGLAVASLATLGAGKVGATQPTDETVPVNVGYASQSGRDAVLTRASTVHYEFGFDALTVQMPASAMDALAARRDTRYVEENRALSSIVTPQLQPRRQVSGQRVPYGISATGADVAAEQGFTGSGASVAVLDTGIDSTHPDLEENLGSGAAFVPGINDIEAFNFPAGQDDDLLVSHGTHVAGVIGGIDNDIGVVGVSPAATLHAVKVLVGVFGGGSVAAVAAGVEFAADQGWDVMNLSLGEDERSEVLADAVADAYERGVLVVAAAGNEGVLESDPPASDGESSVSYPAAFEEVVAVGATDQNDDLAPFSSVGEEIDLVAPGTAVLSTALPVNIYSNAEKPFHRYIELSGTSFAAPHVAGAGALLMSDAGLSNVEARERLQKSAADLGLDVDEQGFGRLDVAAAVGVE
ncbi:Subtilisin [halophilic archaeon DL31]|jgi:Subtilisin-like serine proteases|nr:Subtilisin [halophilic archaeon DL31]